MIYIVYYAVYNINYSVNNQNMEKRAKRYQQFQQPIKNNYRNQLK